MRLAVLLLGCTICALPVAPVTAYADTPCIDIGWQLPGTNDPKSNDCEGTTCAERTVWTDDEQNPTYWIYVKICVV